MSGKICGIKSTGRQSTKYTDSLNNFVTRKKSLNNEIIRRTDDREDWKATIADVCNRPGIIYDDDDNDDDDDDDDDDNDDEDDDDDDDNDDDDDDDEFGLCILLFGMPI